MDIKSVRNLLRKVKEGKVSVEEAVNILKILPYQNLDFAKIDSHRVLRKGFPEAIFCEGKSTEQILAIIDKMVEQGVDILATRASRTVFETVKSHHPQARYFEKARIIIISKRKKRGEGMVLVITAGTSDIPVGEEAAVTAEFMGSRVKRIYDVGVAGIHRLLDWSSDIMKARVIIVIAGMEGALASVVGGIAPCPVIAVPTSIGYGASFKGIAPLLTMLNSCAPGVSVVNIDNGYGAGYLASLINRKR